MKKKALVDVLTEDISKDRYFKGLFSKAEKLSAYKHFNIPANGLRFNEKECLDLLRFADILSHSSEASPRNQAYKIISLLSELENSNNDFNLYANAVLSKVGNFPALKYLSEHSDRKTCLPFERQLEHILKEEVQRVPHEDMVFTDSQYKIFELLKNNNHFSFSGPTSLGKSFIIESFVKYLVSRKGTQENIIILVPTRALINQVSIKLKSNLQDVTEYKILTHPVVPEYFRKKQTGYIFVFTPERLILFLSNQNNPKVEYLFVDEAQKVIAEKDTRSPLYYHSILQAEKKSIRLFFSSPNIPNPEVFLQVFEKSTDECLCIQESPVTQNKYFLDLIERRLLFFPEFETDHSMPLDITDTSLFFWLKRIGANQTNIIYCNTIKDTIDYARDFASTLPDANNSKINDLISLVKDTLHKDYFLIDCLKKGVAFHFGKLPQRIRIRLEELFRNKVIDWVFCTSTLLEGVNLPAKNMFILSNAIGTSKFTSIDFWNLAGRAGRLTKELSGNIICLRAEDKGGRWDNPEKDLTVVRNTDVPPMIPMVIKGQKNFFKNIENSLNNKDFSNKNATQAQKDIWNSYANIAVIHEIRRDESVLRANFIEKNNNGRRLLKRIVKQNQLPDKILTASSSIKIKYQNDLYSDLSETDTLPEEIDYDNILKVLNRLYSIYHWDTEESGGRNPMIVNEREILKYYATLMNEWIKSSPLNKMVYTTIRYYEERGEIWLDKITKEIFDKHNKTHINFIINKLMGDIDNVLRFKFEKYFNNYHMIFKYKFGEKKAGSNWAEFLEYGTTDKRIIELQNIGFSRHLAKYILDNHSDCLLFDDEVLEELRQEKLEADFDKESDEYKEYKELF